MKVSQETLFYWSVKKCCKIILPPNVIFSSVALGGKPVIQVQGLQK